MQRVVITGIGILCPLGAGVPAVWQALLAGRSGIGTITHFNTDLPCRIAGQIPSGAWGPGLEPARGERLTRMTLMAAQEALDDAGWAPRDIEDQLNTGISLGSGCGGIEAAHDAALRIAAATEAALPPAMIHYLTAEIGRRFGLCGPRRGVATACAAGSHAIGDAARMIQLGDAEVMLAGGAEAAVHELALAGFAAARALSTQYNDAPQEASRPWDAGRDGFVMAEGVGLLVLESLEHAWRRGARIHAEIVGYGMSGDAWHITGPAEDGDGAFRAMRAALAQARMSPEEVGYVNAHGTSTPAGDDIELAAVERLFGSAVRSLAMSSTKSATGHLLGAAGAVEAIFSVLAIRDGVAPPTLNLRAPSRSSAIDRVPLVAQQRHIDAVLSNSFGFGGTNAALVFRRA